MIRFFSPALSPVRVENKLSIDISVQTRLEGHALVVTVAPLNDRALEVIEHESTIVLPTIAERISHGS